MGQYRLSWWVSEGVYLDRAAQISACKNERAVGDE